MSSELPVQSLDEVTPRPDGERQQPGGASPGVNVERTTPEKGPLRILLADDAADSRLLIQAFLRQLACRIDVAEDGAAAVERFAGGEYDLVLLDMQMPVMDGYAAVRALREWEAKNGRRAVPVIALSAYVAEEEARQSREAGCTTHLRKPIKKAALLEAIAELTRGRRE